MKTIVEKHQGLIIKLLFFLTYAGAAAWLTYFYIYLKEDAKLSGFEIGIIAGFQQINHLFVLPIWGLWADKFGRKKMLLISIGTTLLLLPIFLFLNGAAAFTLFMIMVTLFYNPIISLLDTVALDYEQQSKGKSNYGQIRLWASLGWGASSLITGLFINQENLQYIFPLSSIILLCSWLILFSMYKPLSVTKNINKLNRGVIWGLLKENPLLFSFLLLVFFYSLFSAPIYLMLNLYYNEINAPTNILGLAILVQCLFELPFFFYGKKIVDRYGALNVFIFTMIATGLRMLAYGLNSSPYMAVAIGSIHGIGIGLFFVSVISFVHRMIPENLRSTGQSIMYTFYAAGVALGNIFTGIFDDFFSIKTTMLIYAAGILILATIVILKRNTYKLPETTNQ